MTGKAERISDKTEKQKFSEFIHFPILTLTSFLFFSTVLRYLNSETFYEFLYTVKFLTISMDWTPSWEKGQDSQEIIHIYRTQMFIGICQVPASSSYSEPCKFRPHTPSIPPHYLTFFLISSSHLCLGPSYNLFPLCFLFADKKCFQTPHFNV